VTPQNGLLSSGVTGLMNMELGGKNKIRRRAAMRNE